jgi:hypothetical protein
MLLIVSQEKSPELDSWLRRPFVEFVLFGVAFLTYRPTAVLTTGVGYELPVVFSLSAAFARKL